MKRNSAFTLIELLIVVAIIAILAAIAVPNFLEAQTRSKVSRSKADMKTIATGIESYRVDNNHYPPSNTEDGEVQPPWVDPWFDSTVPYILTTPVAYVTSLAKDVFNHNPGYNHYHYGSRQQQEEMNETATVIDTYVQTTKGVSGSPCQYYIMSHGPDQDHNAPDLSENPDGPMMYDPTNGTVSPGDIIYFGPGIGF